jgi:hypothetical protein
MEVLLQWIVRAMSAPVILAACLPLPPDLETR